MITKETLLIIGDRKVNRIKVSPSFEEFVNYAQRLKKKTLEVIVISYAHLLSGKVPAIGASVIKIVFFFPYQYWNRNIEIYPDARIYGDRIFGREFNTFFREVKKAIDRYYSHKRIKYLNPPRACYLDRDKKASKSLLEKSKVSTPRTFRVCSFRDIQRLVKEGIKLYIKPRFGALAKGVTYIDKKGAFSNFLFHNGRIISRPYDYNWRFSRIKNEREFINKILKRGFICEEAVESAAFKNRRFDFRIYVIFDNVVYLYAKSSSEKFWVTNWSQGGKIDKKKIILKALPKGTIGRMKKLAKKAARALGLNFAGIDIIFSKDYKYAYVLEGNAFPGYEKGFDLMECLLKSVVKQL